MRRKFMQKLTFKSPHYNREGREEVLGMRLQNFIIQIRLSYYASFSIFVAVTDRKGTLVYSNSYNRLPVAVALYMEFNHS